MYRKSILLCSCLIMLFIDQLLAQQNPNIEWSKAYGGSEDDWASSIEQTIDGGYIICGVTYSSDGDAAGNHGQSDIWVSKLDGGGNIQWERVYGGSNYENCGSIKQTSDHGYIFCGSTDSNDGDVIGNHDGGDAWIVKIDTMGAIQWQKYFGGSGGDGAFDIQLCLDSGYVFTGSTNSTDGDIDYNHGGNDVWVVKLGSNGDKMLSKTYGGSGGDEGSAIAVTLDGGYIIASNVDAGDGDISNANYHGISDYWILKIDSLGSIQWSKCFGGTNAELVYSIHGTNEEGYIIGGISRSIDGDVTGHHGTTTKYDYWIVKITESGNLIWQRSLGGTNDDQCFSIMKTNDGQFVAAGYATSDDGDVTFNHSNNSDAWIVKLDSSGILQWQYSYGGSNSDGETSILQSSDGSYIFFGESSSNDYDVNVNNGGLDYWIVKLSSSTLVNIMASNKTCFLYPNPASDIINFQDKEWKGEIEIRDIIGNLIFSDEYFLGEHLVINVEKFARGIYFFNFKNSH